MTKISDLHEKWLHDKAYQEAYDALEDEFALAAALIEARSRAGLTQGELADRMRTTQSAVARIEGGHITTFLIGLKSDTSLSKKAEEQINDMLMRLKN